MTMTVLAVVASVKVSRHLRSTFRSTGGATPVSDGEPAWLRLERQHAALELKIASSVVDREAIAVERRRGRGDAPLGPRCDTAGALETSWGAPTGYELHAPNMSASERIAMLQYVRGEFASSTWDAGDATYLEWGTGGSTATFGTAAGTAYSVENVPEWCADVESWPETRCMARSNRWRLRCHDTGMPLGAWGYPAVNATTRVGLNRRYRDAMRGYVLGPKYFPPTTYDVVLIDGRHRNACAYAIVPYLRSDSVVAWHDFDDASWRLVAGSSGGVKVDVDEAEPDPGRLVGERQYWKAARRLFTPVARVDTLAFFRVKPAVYSQLALMSRRRRLGRRRTE